MTEKINDDLRSFIYEVTLFLQKSRSSTPEQMDRMFQRAYKLYAKYDVENTRHKDEECETCKHYREMRLIPCGLHRGPACGLHRGPECIDSNLSLWKERK